VAKSPEPGSAISKSDTQHGAHPNGTDSEERSTYLIRTRRDDGGARRTRKTGAAVFSDTGDRAVLELRNGSLNHSLNCGDPNPDATVTLTRDTLNSVIVGETDLLQPRKTGGSTSTLTSRPSPNW
jgi:Alkyl sulfatase C-terminal